LGLWPLSASSAGEIAQDDRRNLDARWQRVAMLVKGDDPIQTAAAASDLINVAKPQQADSMIKETYVELLQKQPEALRAMTAPALFGIAESYREDDPKASVQLFKLLSDTYPGQQLTPKALIAGAQLLAGSLQMKPAALQVLDAVAQRYPDTPFADRALQLKGELA